MNEQQMKDIAQRLLDRGLDTLDEAEMRVLRRFSERSPVSRQLQPDAADKLSFGERLADRVARFGGSWTFIMLFGAMLAVWIAVNTIVLAQRAFDSYPFVFLNLILSMIAAMQAPVIMMSQNRQSAKDRLDAAHDYEVNLKAELEILALHEKLDRLREGQVAALVTAQQEQTHLLRSLLDGRD